MKKLLVISLGLLVLASIGFAAYAHYTPYRDAKVAAERSQQAAQAKQVNSYKQQLITSQQSQRTLVKAYNALQLECLKGVAPATKLKVVAPACGAQLVE